MDVLFSFIGAITVGRELSKISGFYGFLFGSMLEGNPHGRNFRLQLRCGQCDIPTLPAGLRYVPLAA